MKFVVDTRNLQCGRSIQSAGTRANNVSATYDSVKTSLSKFQWHALKPKADAQSNASSRQTKKKEAKAH